MEARKPYYPDPNLPLQGRHCAGLLALIPHPVNLQEFLIDKTSSHVYTLYLPQPEMPNAHVCVISFMQFQNTRNSTIML